MVNMGREMKQKVEEQLITFDQFLSHWFSFRTLSSVMWDDSGASSFDVNQG